MKRRKMISLLVVGIMVLMSFTVLADQHMATVALWINGAEVEADSPPIIINDRSMVPLRVITENMGGIVEWNAAARRAEVTTPAKVFGEKWAAEGMLIWPAEDAAMLVAQNQAMVLDVRPPASFEADGVPGAVNIPVPQLANRMGELDQDMTYVVYCASDINAAYAVAILTMNNFDAYVIVGGRVAFTEAWEAIDHDMIEEEEEE
ncbi:MAG: stalk domain-containing protein, partial [Bacillota bacterium]|nr:stalk domain-containing protein [Bacillota bacterium]